MFHIGCTCPFFTTSAICSHLVGWHILEPKSERLNQKRFCLQRWRPRVIDAIGGDRSNAAVVDAIGGDRGTDGIVAVAKGVDDDDDDMLDLDNMLDNYPVYYAFKQKLDTLIRNRIPRQFHHLIFKELVVVPKSSWSFG